MLGVTEPLKTAAWECVSAVQQAGGDLADASKLWFMIDHIELEHPIAPVGEPGNWAPLAACGICRGELLGHLPTSTVNLDRIEGLRQDLALELAGGRLEELPSGDG